MPRVLKRILPALAFFLFTREARAFPQFIVYQGRYTNNGVASTGTVSMEFRITNGNAVGCGASNANLFWTSGVNAVPTSNGLFSYKIGLQPDGATQDPAFANMNWTLPNTTYYIDVCATGASMSPKEPIGSSVFSIYAASANYASLAGGIAGSTLVTSTISVQVLNNVQYADQFPGADAGAKLAACISAVAAMQGGICDARGFPANAAQNINQNIFAGMGAQHITVLFGYGTFNVFVTQSVPAVAGEGVSLMGQVMRAGSNTDGTLFLWRGAANSAMFDFSNDSGRNSLSDLHLDLGAGPGGGTCTAIKIAPTSFSSLWNHFTRVHIGGFHIGILLPPNDPYYLADTDFHSLQISNGDYGIVGGMQGVFFYNSDFIYLNQVALNPSGWSSWNIFGGHFGSNGYDLAMTPQSGNGPKGEFNGVWFENSVNGIIQPNNVTLWGPLNFHDCNLSTAKMSGYIVDTTGITGQVNFIGNVFSQAPGQNITNVNLAPTLLGSTLLGNTGVPWQGAGNNSMNSMLDVELNGANGQPGVFTRNTNASDYSRLYVGNDVGGATRGGLVVGGSGAGAPWSNRLSLFYEGGALTGTNIMSQADLRIYTGGQAEPGNRRLTIDSSGNVGIGTANPAARLSFGTLIGSPAVYLFDGGAGVRYGNGINGGEYQFFVQGTDSGHHFSWNGGGDLQASGTNELMRLTAAGQLGIGTTNPQAALDINGLGRLKTTSGTPPTCNATVAGSFGLTSSYKLCVCNGTSWVLGDGATACPGSW